MRNIIINSKEIWQCEIERNLLDNRWDNLSSILSFVQPRDGGGEKNRGVAEEKREAPGERYLDTVPLNPSIVERNRFVSARRRTIRKQPFPLPRPSTRWIATSLNFERTFVSIFTTFSSFVQFDRNCSFPTFVQIFTNSDNSVNRRNVADG